MKHIILRLVLQRMVVKIRWAIWLDCHFLQRSGTSQSIVCYARPFSIGKGFVRWRIWLPRLPRDS